MKCATNCDRGRVCGSSVAGHSFLQLLHKSHVTNSASFGPRLTEAVSVVPYVRLWAPMESLTAALAVRTAACSWPWGPACAEAGLAPSSRRRALGGWLDATVLAADVVLPTVQLLLEEGTLLAPLGGGVWYALLETELARSLMVIVPGVSTLRMSKACASARRSAILKPNSFKLSSLKSSSRAMVANPSSSNVFRSFSSSPT
jgi:hypothetical protein